MKKIIGRLTYYALPLLLITAALLFPSIWLFSKYGTAAFLLLAGNLYLRPISVLVKNKYISLMCAYRRELGVASFWFYFFHSAGMFQLYGLTPQSFLNTNSHLFWAGLAAPIMYMLTLTSNDKAVNALKRNWKRIHRLSYPLFFFVLIHSSLAHGEVGRIFILGIPFIILKALEFRKISFSW